MAGVAEISPARRTSGAPVSRADGLRVEQKQFGKLVGKARGEERDALLAKGRELAAKVEALLTDAHKRVSNAVEDGAPAGGEDDY
jgi:seryl-tRNA synthetase